MVLQPWTINTVMKMTDVKTVSEASSPATDDWSQLKLILDRLYNKSRALGSSVKRVNQAFDAKTGEQVVVLQYRFTMPHQGPIPKSPRKVKLVPGEDHDKK